MRREAQAGFPPHRMYGARLPAIVRNSSSDSGSFRNAAHACCGAGLRLTARPTRDTLHAKLADLCREVRKFVRCHFRNRAYSSDVEP